jgi:hypothetical protein
MGRATLRFRRFATAAPFATMNASFGMTGLIVVAPMAGIRVGTVGTILGGEARASRGILWQPQEKHE